MHVQVVTYKLAPSMGEVTDSDFADANQEFAQMMAVVPGLLTKLWLNNVEDKIYGGIYIWQDQDACETFKASDLWASVVDDDTVEDLVSDDFTVMGDLTKMTQPSLQLL